jgi:DNA invertase Pin-like site-specific DNA recombinase
MATIGYIRVSTDRQEVENQRHKIQGYAEREGLVIDAWVEAEVSSRKSTKARRLDETLDLLRRGDVLIVSELSRIGRSIRENLNTLHELGQKGVTTHIVAQGLRTNGKNDVLATMLLTNISFAAELERDLISQRTKAALARKKAEGMKLGMAAKDEALASTIRAQGVQAIKAKANHQAESLAALFQSFRDRGLTQRQMAEELTKAGVQPPRGRSWSQATVCRMLRRVDASSNEPTSKATVETPS